MPQSVATGTLAVEGLDKAFGATRVLDQAGLLAPAGRVVALLGPSGCGKTTLLRCIAGLERPDAGRVRARRPGPVGPRRVRRARAPPDRDGVPGRRPVPPPDRRRQRRLRPVAAPSAAGARVAEALELVDLAGFGDRLPASCPAARPSGSPWPGRWSPRPSVLLLDEPFSNLDTILRVQIRAEVQRLLADLGVTAVFVTHDQEEAFVVGDEVAVMLAGRVVQQAAPAELYRAPRLPGGGRLPRRRQPAPGGGTRPAWPTPPSGGCRSRAELAGHVDVLAAARAAAASAPGAAATIDSVQYFGHDAVYLTPAARRGGPAGAGARTPPSSGPATPSTSTTSAARPSATRGPPLADPADLVILGAGPAGVGAAYRTARAGHRVVVLERAPGPGGAAASFELDGIRVDHGSHRLHPAIDPRILGDLRGLLGDDLQRRPRNGRIHLEGRWIRFPLRPADLARRLPPSFAAGVAVDAATAWARRPRADTFAETLRAGLGPTMCQRFYFPYARKLWGLDPDELAGEQARRRVSAGSPGRLLARVARGRPPRRPLVLVPQGRLRDHLRAPGRRGRRRRGRAALPDRGRAGRARPRGGDGHPGRRGAAGGPAGVVDRPPAHPGQDDRPGPAPAVLEAAGQLGFRAMVLVYLVLDGGRYSDYDAHYLPDPGTPVTRVSEPAQLPRRRRPAEPDGALRRAALLARRRPVAGRQRPAGRAGPGGPVRPRPARAGTGPAGRRPPPAQRLPGLPGRLHGPRSRPWTPGRPPSRPCSASAASACSCTTTPTTPWPWPGPRPTP